MNIIVCAKQIPDPASPGELDPADHTLKRDGKLILDESDMYGVEMALQLVDAAGGGEVSLVSMAPNGEVAGLRTALAMGAAKAVLVSDPELAGSDALTTAKVLAAAAQRLGDVDLIIAGTESTDGYTGTVPEQVAEVLGLPSVTFAKSVAVEDGVLKVNRQTEAGYDEVTCPLPGRRQRDRRRRRAPLPELQGDHGGEVEAGRHRHRRRPRRVARSAGPAPASRSSTSPTRRSGSRARSSRTTARPTPRSSSSSPGSRSSERSGSTMAVSQHLGVRPGRRRRADLDDARAADQGSSWLRGCWAVGGAVTAFVAGDATELAAALGEYGATKVYATGDLGGALPGVAVGGGDQGRDRRRRRRRT